MILRSSEIFWFLYIYSRIYEILDGNLCNYYLYVNLTVEVDSLEIVDIRKIKREIKLIKIWK